MEYMGYCQDKINKGGGRKSGKKRREGRGARVGRIREIT